MSFGDDDSPLPQWNPHPRRVGNLGEGKPYASCVNFFLDSNLNFQADDRKLGKKKLQCKRNMCCNSETPKKKMKKNAASSLTLHGTVFELPHDFVI